MQVLELDFPRAGIAAGGFLQGWCHLRRARREFRLERILAAWDPDTGEVIPDLAARFAAARGAAGA